MQTREVSVKGEDEEEWLITQQSKGFFGKLFGVICSFPNSFDTVPCQSVRKNVKHLKWLFSEQP